jgi:molecular chaperone GrpE
MTDKPDRNAEQAESIEPNERATDPDAEDLAEDVNGSGASSEPSDAERLAAAERESKRHYDSYLRAQAELANVIRRHERDLGDRSRYEGEALIKDLLSVVDDLERALEHADAGAEGFAEGVKMVRDGLLAALEKHGVKRIETVGRSFDPAVHEAIAMVESADHEPNAVIEAHRAGYMLRDRLLRAALVVVAKGPSNS